MSQSNAFSITIQDPSAVPTWLSGAATFEWVQLQSISASTGPSPAMPGGRKNVVDAWCGAALRQSGSYYIIQGGGHGDYSGNEIYTLKLSDNSPTWQLAWGPTPEASLTTTPYYSDGNPATAHTYNQLHFDDASDRLYRICGGYWITSGVPSNVDSIAWSAMSGYGAAGTASGWAVAGTHPSVPDPAVTTGAFITRNSSTGEFYFWGSWYRYRWTPGNPSWTTGIPQNVAAVYSGCVYDPVNNCVWAFGGNNAVAGTLQKWDIATNVASRPAVTGNGVAVCTQTKIGATWDSVNNCAWIYNDTGSVYRFNPSDMTISLVTMTGTAPSASSVYGNVNGTWNRIRYVPELKGVVIAPAWAAPTFFFRTS